MPNYISKFKKAIYYPSHLFSGVKPQVLIYLHLPKCGGTSISHTIKKNCNPWRVFEYEVSGRRTPGGKPLSLKEKKAPDNLAIKKLLAKYGSKIEVLMGHIPYGIHRYLGNKECRYFTVVRDPIDRVWSSFSHIAERENHYLYNTLKKHDFNLVKILENENIFEFKNDQTRMLLGSRQTDLSLITEKDISFAVNSKYYYIDILENVKLLLEKVANDNYWPKLILPNKNIGKYMFLGKNPSSEVHKTIAKYNDKDIILYNIIKNLR